MNKLTSLFISDTDIKELPESIFSLKLESISWRRILQKFLSNSNYPQAIQAAQNLIQLEPENSEVYSNLALAYLLNNQYAKAKEIYLEWKGKPFSESGRKLNFDFKFIKDIYMLEKKGIHHPDFEKVKKLLAE